MNVGNKGDGEQSIREGKKRKKKERKKVEERTSLL